MVDSDWGELIDDLDKVKTLNDTQNAYTMAAAAAMGRRIDKHIAVAYTGLEDFLGKLKKNEHAVFSKKRVAVA